MPTMCNACGAIYELWSEAIECHPDVKEVSEEQFAEYKAAQQNVQPTGGILPDFLASLTPEQLSALKVLLTPPTSG